MKSFEELGGILREPKCRILSTDPAMRFASVFGLENALHFPPPSFVRMMRTLLV